MPLGTGDLGFGVAFTLKDNFTATSRKIKESFKSLDEMIKNPKEIICQ